MSKKVSIQAKEREWSTVVDISIPPPSFKPVSLSFSRFPLSKTPKQVFFNPINIFDIFYTTLYYCFYNVKKKTCLGVLDTGDRDKDNEIGLKEGGGIKIETTVLHSRSFA